MSAEQNRGHENQKIHKNGNDDPLANPQISIRLER